MQYLIKMPPKNIYISARDNKSIPNKKAGKLLRNCRHNFEEYIWTL